MSTRLAPLAGVSVEYYKRLERGNANGISGSVLEATASALRLDDAERAHLHDLAHANSARFTFLDPAAQEFYLDWERVAKDLVGHLRSEAGRNPYDRGLCDLVGELSTRSPEFRTWHTRTLWPRWPGRLAPGPELDGPGFRPRPGH